MAWLCGLFRILPLMHALTKPQKQAKIEDIVSAAQVFWKRVWIGRRLFLGACSS